MPDLMQGAIEGKGGQGVLFLGGLLGRVLSQRFDNVSVSPSYTAEMFGGPCHSYVVAATGVVAAPVPERVDFAVAFPNCTPRLIPRLMQAGTWLVSTSAGRADVDVYVQRGPEGKKQTVGTIALGKRTRSNVFLFGVAAHALGIETDVAVEAVAQTVRGEAGREQAAQLREFLAALEPFHA